MRSLNRQHANTFSGDSFYFADLAVCIFYDIWDKYHIVMVWRPGVDHGQYLLDDKKIACFTFDNLDDAAEICEYIQVKIALADALFGWEL